MEPVRVLIVAGDPLVRAGLAALLANQPECTVVGPSDGKRDLAGEVGVFQPDVVIWDPGWPVPERLTPREPSSDSSTLTDRPILSTTDLEGLPAPVLALLIDDGYVAAAWKAGARGLLPRDAGAEVLVAALHALAEGLVVVDPAWTASLLSRDQPGPEPAEELTPRELEVLQLLAEGLPNKAIARRLGISDHTAKFHVNSILSKLGASSRTEAVVRATRLGLIIL